MGEVCCRRNNLGPETELYSSPPYDNPLSLESKRPKVDPIFLSKLEMKFGSHISSIVRIQAWYRGCSSRRTYRARPLNCMGVIRYIAGSLKSHEAAVRAVEERLGPFVVSWSLEQAKREGLELRKVVTEKGNMVYHGYWSAATNKKQGYGQELFPNGTKYEGFWTNGEFDGQGRFIYENGDYFFGDWKHGRTQGSGTFISTEGTKYNGEWKNNLHHGHGTFNQQHIGVEVWEDGSHFEGNYIEGRKEGRGKFFWTDGSVYEGEFRDNKLEGHGVYRWNDGRVYEGQWKSSRMEGKGKFTFPDGKVYVGEMRNDLRHGKGKMIWYGL